MTYLVLWQIRSVRSQIYIQGCWQVLSPTRKETSYSDRFWFSCVLFLIIGGILVLFIYITRLASNEIFSPSNKIHREVGRAKDLSAPLWKAVFKTQAILTRMRPQIVGYSFLGYLIRTKAKANHLFYFLQPIKYQLCILGKIWNTSR